MEQYKTNYKDYLKSKTKEEEKLIEEVIDRARKERKKMDL